VEAPDEVGGVVRSQPRTEGDGLFILPYRYKKYVFLDPLAGAVTKTHVMLGADTEEKLFDAPLSISKREQLERQVELEGAWVGGWALPRCFSEGRLYQAPYLPSCVGVHARPH
jgi:hypothetical protein